MDTGMHLCSSWISAMQSFIQRALFRWTLRHLLGGYWDLGPCVFPHGTHVSKTWDTVFFGNFHEFWTIKILPHISHLWESLKIWCLSAADRASPTLCQQDSNEVARQLLLMVSDIRIIDIVNVWHVVKVRNFQFPQRWKMLESMGRFLSTES